MDGGTMLLYYLIALVVILIDQVTKWFVNTTMDLGESIPIIERVLYITSHRNQGAAFGILQGQMWFFYIVTIVVIGVLVYYIQKEAKNSRFLGITLGVILGGAIGNFIDRVVRGEVTDFVDVYIFTYNFAIFNVADMALVIGVGLFIIYTIIDERKSKEK
jgi:signal peptidase II